MELKPETGSIFLNEEQFASLCLTVFKNGPIDTDSLYHKFYYNGITFEINSDYEEGLYIEILD